MSSASARSLLCAIRSALITRACAFVYSERLSGASRGWVMSGQLPTHSNQRVPGIGQQLEGHERNCADSGQPGRAARRSLNPTGRSVGRQVLLHCAPAVPGSATWIFSWSISAGLPAVASDRGPPVAATVCDAMSIEWPKVPRGNASDSS